MSQTMRAAVFVKPFVVETITKNIPKITRPTDALVKVRYSGLCGSDLHYYRGHIPLKNGNTMGHEFVGTIVEKGTEISDEVLAVGDEVISTFTIQCGNCYFCKSGNTGTCDVTNTFGKSGLEGAQAEYVLVPYASTTLVRKPEGNTTVNDALYVLMADIFVTGYFGVKKILDHFRGVDPKQVSVLQIGSGPVGLCSTRILSHFGFKNVVVVDGIDSRLGHASALGASNTVNFKTEPDKLGQLKTEITSDRGFDAVLEIVGASASMKTAFDNVRRGGFISSVGMGHDPLPFNALEAYVKCVTVSFGRCNAWTLFGDSLEIFEKVKDDFSDFIDVVASIEDAGEYYEKFERGDVQKVVFKFDK